MAKGGLQGSEAPCPQRYVHTLLFYFTFIITQTHKIINSKMKLTSGFQLQTVSKV